MNRGSVYSDPIHDEFFNHYKQGVVGDMQGVAEVN